MLVAFVLFFGPDAVALAEQTADESATCGRLSKS